MSLGILRLTALLLTLSVFSSQSIAGVLATGYFDNTVYRFDDFGSVTNTFVLETTGFAGLSGIAVDPATGRAYASGRENNRIYVFDNNTGVPIAVTPTGTAGLFLNSGVSAPTGLAVRDGKLYVANNGGTNSMTGQPVYNGTSISVFSVSTGLLLSTISDTPGAGILIGPSGLTFQADGSLLATSAAGNGVVKVSTSGSISSFASPTAAGPYLPNGIAVATDGSVFVADVFSTTGVNGVFKYNSSGVNLGTAGGPSIVLDPLFPAPGTPNPSFGLSKGVSGLAFDSNGNLFVAALGATNPLPIAFGGEGLANGALFRVNASDGSITIFATRFSPLSAVAIQAVPEPSSIALVGIFAAGMVRIHLRRVARSKAANKELPVV